MRRWVLLLKITVLVALSLSVAFLLLHELYYTALMVALGVVATACSIYAERQKVIRRMERLIANIHYGDLNLSFPATAKGTEGELARSMNEALASFRSRLYHSVVAEAENEAWQKLIKVLTHEIMNSLAPVISLAETVSERAAQNGMNERDYQIMLQAVQTIHRRSKGLLEFVENYRRLTRIPLPVVAPFLVADLFTGIAGLFPALEMGITYHVTPPGLSLKADRSQIEQVLVNLLKNAVEAMEGNPSPRIRVEALRRDDRLLITVSDNGSGIIAEAIDKIFVPFFTTKPGGSGIGLSICRQIMNRHGGAITVASEPERGTLFTLHFPS
jgi:signal transduction histidine kinase